MDKDPVTVERLAKSRIVCTVRFDAAQSKAAEEQAIRELGSNMNIKGFRPGHAPADMVRERITPDDLFEATARVLLKEQIPALITEHRIAPVIAPKVEAVSRDPLTLKITFIERPDVTIKNPDTLTIGKKEIAVEQKDIDKVVQGVRRENRRKTETDRAANEGDEATVDFSALDSTGKDIAGLTGKDEQVEIGSKTYLPGFEDALKGLKKGDEKTFTLTLPEKFPVEELRNQPATFRVTVKKVEEVELPELTDAYVQKMFGLPTLADFHKRVEESIRSQEEQHERIARERKLLDEIRTRTQVDIADELLEEEVRDMVREWAERLEQQGTTIADVLKKQGKTPEEAEKELRTQALDRWKLRLGLQKLIELKNITVTAEDLEQMFASFKESLPADRQDAAAQEWQERGNLYGEIRWRALVDKTIDVLLA